MFVQRLNIQSPSVKIFGDGLYQAQVNVQSSFVIHASSIFNQLDEVKIITHPSEYPCQIDITDNHDGTWTVNYTPKEIGQIQIDIFLDDKRTNSIPYKINVFDINQVIVSNLIDGFVDQLVKFHIDTTQAGIGQLEIIVEDGQVSCDVISRASSQYDVTFLPHTGGLYKIDIRFNGLIIPGGPFSCFIKDLSRVIVSNSITNAHVGHKLSFDIDNRSEFFDVHILAPSGRSVPYQRSHLNENQTRIDYLLDEIGLHRVDVRSTENMNIYGSSFSLQAYDTNRLIISDIPHFVIFNQPVEFTIDASKAGEGQLEVDINNGRVPNKVKALGNSKFHFTFLPLLNEPHRLSIKFNGQQLPGFPKECQVISSDNIRIRSLGLNQVLLNTQTWFIIDTPHDGLSDLQVTIFTPTNEQFNPSTLLTSAGLRVDWTPTEIGTYIIHTTIHDKPIPGSPFHVKCYDPKRVIVIPPINDSSIYKPTKFLIDASKAGEGNLEISVNYSGHNIPNQIIPIGNSRFEVQFTPQKATIHHCNILFNGELIPGSPFAVNVMEVQRIMAIGKGLGSIPIHIPTSFNVLTQNSLGKDLRCSIKGPNDHLISCIITKIDPNRYEVTYTPDRVGEYRIEILYDNIPIDNSPFLSRSFDVNKIKIQDFPSSTLLGSSTYFIIDATDSGSGNLEIAISRDGKNIPNYVQNEGGARFRIKFIPDQALPHHVQIKFNGIEITGSPFICNVYSSEFIFENYEYAPIHKLTSFSIKPRLNSALNPNIHVDIITPSGRQIKGKISANSYTIDFLPTEIGDHEIRFYNDEEKNFLLTKFICQVYDISKIRISDLPFAIVYQPYKFTINTTDAGNGVLSVKIKQNEKKISHEQTRISVHIYEISFIPETTDDCTIQISFNGENSLHKITIPVKADCEQVRVSSIPSGIVGQPIVFTIDAAEFNLISVVINESHSGRVVPHTMIQKSTDKNQSQISFIPNLARQHTVSISYDGKLVSTHHVDVCNLNKIRVSSITDGTIGNPSIFSVDTHGAGEGHLEVTISDGQRTLPAQLKSTQARKFDIAFVPETSGKHSIVIAFNSIPIEGSPFTINIQEPTISEPEEEEEEEDDHEFIIGGQLQGTKVGEVAWLICETALTDIYEDCDLYVIDPDETMIKHTRIQDSAGRWRVEFEPTKVGGYKIQTDIDQSPMTLASMEILPVNYERYIFGERIVHPKVANFLSINSRNENLKIQLKSSNGTEIPIEVERDSSEWKMYFTLTEIDVYQLSITDEQVFQIHCVSEETDLFRNGGIEDIARIIIDHKKISSDDVNVIVKDPFAHTIPAAFYRNSNNDLIIEYIPIRQDIHEVFIRTQNNLLDICPIRIMAFQSKNTFEPVLRVQVKEVLEHTFAGVVDHDNKLDIIITDPFERQVPFQRSKNELAELTVSLSPVRVGTHWMRISNDENDSFALIPIFAFDDDYIPLSPVGTPSSEDKTIRNRTNSMTESFPIFRDLTTISETSEVSSPRTGSFSSTQLASSIRDISTNIGLLAPNRSPVSNGRSPVSNGRSPVLNGRSPVLNGRSSPEVHILDITDLEDPGIRVASKFSFNDPNDKFDVHIYDANEDEIPYKVERTPDGRKFISYEPMIIGPVEIHITKDNHAIDGSPLIVHAFDPSVVQIINFPKRILINTTNSFLIDPTEAGKGSLKITIKDSNNRCLPINIQKQSNNQIAIQFTPTNLGIHTIFILFNRVSIPNTPLQFFVENIEERGRSIYSKHELLSLAQQQERFNLLSPQTIPSRSSISNDNPSQKDLPNTKSEDKQTEYIPFTEYEIQRFQLLRERFEHRQPIDIIFDPRRYPFKIYFQNSSPFINNDVHILIELPYVVFINITINEMNIPIQIVHKTDTTSLLKFRPIFAGDYSIILKNFSGEALLGCPYILPIYNPNGIHIESFDLFQPINDCHFICNIDNIGQGKFFLMVYHQSKPVRISYKIQSLTQTQIRVSFHPLKIGTYRIYLAYRNFPINGSPIDINVYDLQGVSITAEHKEPVVVKTTVAYKVNINQAGQGELKAELISPETSIIPCRCHVHELNNAEYLIEYIPNEPGRYQLRILFNNHLVQGRTIDTDVYSLLPIPFPSSAGVHIQKIQPDDTPKIGDEVILQIITEKSNMHAQISCNGLSIPYEIQVTKDKHLWHLKFRPYTIGTYKILLFHNNFPIMHSPYLIQVKDIDGKNYLSGLTNTPCMIQVHTKSASNAQIRAVVLLGGTQIPSNMTILHEHLIRINFTPQEPGFYFVNIYNGNQSIEGSPFLIRIKRPQVVQISGKCLDRLRLNDLGIFRIHCHGQRGTVKAKIFHLPANDRYDIGQSISFQLLETYEQLIQFPSQIFQTSLTILLTARLRLTQERIRNLNLQEDNGHAIVSFQLFEIPMQLPTNEQIINVLKNLIDKQTLNLIDPNRNILHAICGSLFIGPRGESVNVKLFSLPNGDYLGEFTPKKIGQYRIDVTFGDKPIECSPFFTEIYNPLEVQISSLPKEIILGIENTLEINTEKAGNAPLEVIITSPSGINIPCKIDDTLTIKRVRFTPLEIGSHYLNVKYGSDMVPGTPMKLIVNETRFVTAYGDGLHHSLQDKIAAFMIDTKGMEGDLKVRIEGSNSVVQNSLEQINNSVFKVTYTPVEVGHMNISIKWNGKDIINSPFTVMVANPERVRMIDDRQSILDSQNHMRVKINEEKKIRFDTSHAGPGTLKATIQSVDNNSIPIRVDQQDTLYTLSFTLIREGQYELIITYANQLLPNMPIRLVAGLTVSDHSKVEVYGLGLYEARVHEEATFTIDVSKASIDNISKPIVRLANQQADVTVRLIEKHRHVFLCSYTPTLPGTYVLTILWLGKEIQGSPFNVNIFSDNQKHNSASQVICSGDGLRMGIVGQEMKCLIDTHNVSPGELTAYCQGNHKIAHCRLFDHRDGKFTLFIKPEESGKHLLTIKYNGENVPGSPYTIKVSGLPDARKVRVSGPGIEHGVLSTFQSNFTCETKGAGAGQLTVKIRGPKGAFRVEMERKHLQDRTIICRYYPTEPGDYLISVKWSGQHVYGSPYHTHIFESQEEFDEYQYELQTSRLVGQQRTSKLY